MEMSPTAMVNFPHSPSPHLWIILVSLDKFSGSQIYMKLFI